MLALESDFFCGATGFFDKISDEAHEARIFIPIKLDGRDDLIFAAVDTGATYSVLAPNIAEDLGINLDDCPEEETLSTKWGRIKGRLCRITVRVDTLDELQDSTGIDLRANFFIPNVDQGWDFDRNFIGLQTFLLAIRFAVDPHPDKMLFYFGGPV
jgi:hypothetical protein